MDNKLEAAFWMPYVQRLMVAGKKRLYPYFPYLSLLALLIGSLVFLVVQMGMSWQVQDERETPYPLDEALYYLSQGSRIPECLGPCPALQDIKRQVDTETTVQAASFQRWAVQYHELVLQNPLMAVMVAILRLFDLSWWTIYTIFIYVGRLLQVIALAFFLTVLWGRAAAGIGLILTAFTIFPGYGLHEIVPSNYAQMIAFLIWGHILIKGRAAAHSLIWGTIVLLLLHPQGRLYALVAWALYVFPFAWPQTRREWSAIGLSLGAVIFYSLLSLVLKWPQLAYFGGFLLPEGMTSTSALRQNIRESVSYVTEWYLQYPFQLLGAILVTGFAFFTLDPLYRRRVLWILLLLGGLDFVLMFHTIPECCWAESFRRNFMLLQIVFYGAVGRTLWVSIHYFIEKGLPAIFTNRRKVSGISLREWSVLAVLVLIYISGRYTAIKVANGYTDIKNQVDFMSLRQNYHLDEAKITTLLASAEQGDIILYTDMVARQFTLMHGGRDYGAIFYPAIENTEIEARWLQDERVRFMVGQNPIERLGWNLVQLDVLRFAAIPSLKYKSDTPALLSELELYLFNPGESFEMVLTVADNETYTIAVPDHFEGWLTAAGLPESPVNEFQLTAPEAPEQAGLKGLRFQNSPYFWPWEQAAQLSTYNSRYEQELVATFDLALVVPGDTKHAEIMDDKGYLLLIRLR